MLPLRLKPVVFATTLSYFIFFINHSKWLPYVWLGLLLTGTKLVWDAFR